MVNGGSHSRDRGVGGGGRGLRSARAGCAEELPENDDDDPIAAVVAGPGGWGGSDAVDESGGEGAAPMGPPDAESVGATARSASSPRRPAST